MKPLLKRNKIDIGLVGQTINNTNVIGKYFSMTMYRKALAILSIGAMAATKTAAIEFLQATDAAGTSAKGIPSTAGQAAIATITANAGVTVATLALASVAAADAVTINGLTFTAHASTTTIASRQFSAAGTDSADGDELVKCINDATYGVPGVTATNASGTLTLIATDPGEATITITNAAATMTPATVQAQGYVEIDVSQLDINNGFVYISPKVTTTSTAGVCAVTLIRSDGRFEPVQKMAAGKIL
ncbi:MAG: hypothetical protein P4N41_18120 [Negativicutes bacterium]|nr:hypothetical protein [Negativicutes bacterium]